MKAETPEILKWRVHLFFIVMNWIRT